MGTLLTLSGTNLDLVTAVAINGTAGVLLAQTSTSMRILVMPGTTSGPLTLTGGTSATSSTSFAVTSTVLNAAQQGAKLIGTGAAGLYAYQGRSVVLSADGNTLAVGGPWDNSFTGATWVYTRSGTNWSQQGAKLIGTGAVGLAYQGTSVALSADGATLATGGNGGNSTAGATWMFIRSGTNWSQQGPKLAGTGALGLANQGIAVALSADGNTLVEGGEGDNNNIGATWVFTRNGRNWSQQGPKLVGTGTTGTGYQGHSLALSADGTTVAVGGYSDNTFIGATLVFSTASSPLPQRTAASRVDASFFPNPVAEQLTLSTGPLGGTLRLLDNMGRSVLAGTYRNGQQLDLSTLAPGLYWLQLDQQAPSPCSSARPGSVARAQSLD